MSERIEASADAARNTHTHWCTSLRQRQHYAVCLNTIHRIEAGEKMPGDKGDCEKAIRNGVCPADQMRDEEVGVGHAIFFAERMRGEILDTHQAANYVPTVRQKASARIVISKASDELDLQNGAGSGGYAELVSTIAGKAVDLGSSSEIVGRPLDNQREHREINPEVADGSVSASQNESPKLEFLPGETPLQAARRAAAAKAQLKG